MLAAAANLSVNAKLSRKATKGAALAFFGRVMLKAKEWQQAADAMKQVADLNKYELFISVKGLFSVANEGNAGLIFVFKSLNTVLGWNNTPHAYPVGLSHWQGELRGTVSVVALVCQFLSPR